MTASKRQLGLVMATALVLGNMIGSGVFLLPASLAPYGGFSLIGWLISAIGALLLAGVFYRLAKRAPRAGGPYAYSREAFGDCIGFLVAWTYWVGGSSASPRSPWPSQATCRCSSPRWARIRCSVH